MGIDVRSLSNLLPEIAIGLIFSFLILRLAILFTNTIIYLVDSADKAAQANLTLLQKSYEDCSKAADDARKEGAKSLADSREEFSKLLIEQREQQTKLFIKLSNDIDALGEKFSFEMKQLGKNLKSAKGGSRACT